MKCWLQCTRLSGREKSSLGTAIHFSQLLFLKSDAVRIKNGIEESTVGLRTYLCTSTPWSLTSVSLAAAEPSFITVPPVPRTSRCQSKIKRNHSKYSFSALTVNMKRHQGCKETWIKTASLYLSSSEWYGDSRYFRDTKKEWPSGRHDSALCLQKKMQQGVAWCCFPTQTLSRPVWTASSYWNSCVLCRAK